MSVGAPPVAARPQWLGGEAGSADLGTAQHFELLPEHFSACGVLRARLAPLLEPTSSLTLMGMAFERMKVAVGRYFAVLCLQTKVRSFAARRTLVGLAHRSHHVPSAQGLQRSVSSCARVRPGTASNYGRAASSTVTRTFGSSAVNAFGGAAAADLLRRWGHIIGTTQTTGSSCWPSASELSTLSSSDAAAGSRFLKRTTNGAPARPGSALALRAPPDRSEVRRRDAEARSGCCRGSAGDGPRAPVVPPLALHHLGAGEANGCVSQSVMPEDLAITERKFSVSLADTLSQPTPQLQQAEQTSLAVPTFTALPGRAHSTGALLERCSHDPLSHPVPDPIATHHDDAIVARKGHARTGQSLVPPPRHMSMGGRGGGGLRALATGSDVARPSRQQRPSTATRGPANRTNGDRKRSSCGPARGLRPMSAAHTGVRRTTTLTGTPVARRADASPYLGLGGLMPGSHGGFFR